MTEPIRMFQNEPNVCRALRRKEDAARLIGELLLRCGITPHLCGFESLSEGVRITAERGRGSERPPLSDLQTAVNSICGAFSPEHAMRNAIGAGFFSRDAICARSFPFPDRPSSAEFICTLAEMVGDWIAGK